MSGIRRGLKTKILSSGMEQVRGRKRRRSQTVNHGEVRDQIRRFSFRRSHHKDFRAFGTKLNMELRSGKTVKSGTSILSLNDDCLSDIFKYLGWMDLINVAETCSGFKDIADAKLKKKCLEFKIDRDMMMTGMERIFSHIGQHVQSLEVDFENFEGVGNILRDIQESCTAMKRLTLKQMKTRSLRQVHFRIYVENLILNDCELGNANLFLDKFCSLKSLYLDIGKKISSTALQNCIRNNPQIEDFAFCLWDAFDILKAIKPLLQLENLTKLKLDCHLENLNGFLMQLAKRSTLQELELFYVEVDCNTFEILKSFKKLHLLNIHKYKKWNDLPDSLALPNLRHLRLSRFEFSFTRFISIIQELKHLENVDLNWWDTLENDSVLLNDVGKVSEQILNALELSGNRHTLTVTLPRSFAIHEDVSKNYIYETSRLRIANNRYVEKYGCVHKVFYSLHGGETRFPSLTVALKRVSPPLSE